MKNTFIKLLLLVVLTNTQLYSQTPTATLTIDFSKRSVDGYTELNKLNKGDFYYVIIKEVNTCLYKISINKKDSIIKSPPVTMPDFGSFALEPLSMLIASIGSITTTASPPTNLEFSLFESFPSVHVRAADPTAIMNYTEKILKEENQNLKKIKFSIDSLSSEISKYLMICNSETKVTGTVTMAEVSAFIKKLRILLNDFSIEEKEAQNYYEEFSATNAPAIKTATLTEQDNKIKASFKTMSEAIDAAQLLISADKEMTLLKAIIQVQNNSTFTYTSLPQQFSGDFNKVAISIDPFRTDVTTQKWTGNYEFPVPKRTYVGTGLSFYLSGLHNEAYSVKSVNDTTYNIVDESPSKAEIGMTVLFRYGWYNNKNVGFHLNIGPGVSLSEKALPRVLGGIGFSFGKRNKLTIDIGGLAGYTMVKSNAYNTSDTYKKLPTNITVAKLTGSAFFSIGYLFAF